MSTNLKPVWRRAGVSPVLSNITLLVRSTVRPFYYIMRINKVEKKPAIRKAEVRSLKIQPKFRVNTDSNKEVPEIKLCGNWLEKLGFVHGRRVLVTTMNELLVIRLQPE